MLKAETKLDQERDQEPREYIVFDEVVNSLLSLWVLLNIFFSFLPPTPLVFHQDAVKHSINVTEVSAYDRASLDQGFVREWNSVGFEACCVDGTLVHSNAVLKGDAQDKVCLCNVGYRQCVACRVMRCDCLLVFNKTLSFIHVKGMAARFCA